MATRQEVEVEVGMVVTTQTQRTVATQILRAHIRPTMKDNFPI